MTLTMTPCCAVHKITQVTPSGRPYCEVCGFEEEPPAMEIVPTGDANFWRLLENGRWIAVIQFNGELLEARQLEIGRLLAAAAKGDA